ncbi:hypothetical protein PENTCL1PPCAC_28886, partial [Pristionchus entomophagus]
TRSLQLSIILITVRPRWECSIELSIPFGICIVHGEESDRFTGESKPIRLCHDFRRGSTLKGCSELDHL